MVLHFPEVDSDHRPVLVKFSETDVVYKANNPFWVLSVWPTNENFGNFVASNWNSNTDYVEMRKRRLLARLGGIQQALEVKPTRGLEHLEKKLKKELESLTQEEMYWQKKSRKDWILLGDRNTNFFHQKTLARRRKNHIIAIMDESGSWLYDTEAIKWHAISCFSSLYTNDNSCSISYPYRGYFPSIEESTGQYLMLPITDDEIKHIIFSMKPLKALGVDGYSALFYQSQ
ncbi:uncharacterized protein LOC107174314 [Citrus sinensis]|uniref:uncharacterized protein LOC107174314 n=1 Tax=Citrus sinensis TaxID=2711 RepID=UPI000763AC25|nr:uncharacterized protein LOC107174314 [Citrus sinensis]XP_024041935.1 uncharacterized protein LOC112099063 [Citrus x clementina]